MGVPQLPLALHYPRDQRLETFIGAPDGALAQLRAIAVGASHDWVYLEGAAGTGKTHQALAMCSSAEQAGRLPTYVPLASAAGRVRAALDGLEARELVALDGLDEVAGNREDEIALFDFHNRARAAGVTVLYTAQKAPGELGLVLPDLRSRLGQCVRVLRSRWMRKDGRPCCASVHCDAAWPSTKRPSSGCCRTPAVSWVD